MTILKSITRLAAGALLALEIAAPALAQPSEGLRNAFRLKDIINIKDPTYGGGAKCDGTTNDRTAINAAAVAAAALTNGGTIVVPSGNCVISTSLTLGATVGIWIQPGGQLSPAGGQTLTINGPIIASPTQIFGGSGSVLISKTYNAEIWADWFTGSDMGAKINKAYAAITGSDQGPGTIKISSQQHNFTTMIDFTAVEGVRLTSDSGYMGLNYSGGPVLNWQGGAGSGSAMKLKNGMYFEFDHIRLQYDKAAYNGTLIDLDSSASGGDASYVTFHHCSVSGGTGATGATRLINLALTYGITIEHCYFNYAAIGIGRSGTSNTVITIRDSYFGSSLSTAAIETGSGAWNIINNVHQNDPAAAPKTFIKLGGDTLGMFVSGNIIGVDSGAGVGTLIDFTAAKAQGVEITGNLFSGGSSAKAIALSTTAGDSAGISISGNNFTGVGTGVVLGRGHGVAIVGNRFNASNSPFTGTEPTSLRVHGNDYNGASTFGTAVANNGTVSITKPGSADDGAQLVSIYNKEWSGHCIYSLNGSAGTTTEVFDQAGLCTPTKANAGTVNIYWEAGTTSYTLQNNSGGAINVIVNQVGGR